MEERKNMKSKRYFSLIELLVVIAVIAILFGLLLPALNAAREKAASANCLSQEKQIGLGLVAYSNDSNGICGNASIVSGMTDDNLWNWALYNSGILANPDLFLCPSFGPEKFDRKNMALSWFKTYGINYAGAESLGGGRPVSFNLKKITQDSRPLPFQPSRMLLLTDSYGKGAAGEQQYFNVGMWYEAIGHSRIHFRHQLRAAAIFFDGHGAMTAMPQYQAAEIVLPLDSWSRKDDRYFFKLGR